MLSLQYETERRTYSKRVLGLTLVPTLGCNFACPYCFEEHKRQVVMGQTMVENVINFINSHTDSQKMDLNWYGGEPLMAIHVIEQLLDKIAAETHIKLGRHNLITNGYYINEKTMGIFRKYPLTTVQITLDGKRERHDSIRKTKNDLPTFDRILQNADYILEEFPLTQLHIRVNIERSNAADYYELAAQLNDRWKGKNVVIYPGFLRIDNDTQTAYSCSCLDKNDIAEMMFDVSSKGLIDFPLYPQQCFSKTCAANRVNAYIVGPEGEIYKCWNDVGDPKKVVGTIQSSKIINKALLMKYIVGSKWYNDASCRDCFFLPICGGTCSWYALRNKYANGRYNLCTCVQKAPGMLDKCLEKYYDAITLK